MLSDFFRINLPYGVKLNIDGKLFAFNREYMPLGWSDYSRKKGVGHASPYADQPIHTRYGDINKKLDSLITKHCLYTDQKEDGIVVFFYNDKTNPQSTPFYWPRYFEIIKDISKFKIEQYETI